MNRRKFLGVLPLAGIAAALPWSKTEAEGKLIDRVVIEKEKLPKVAISHKNYSWHDIQTCREAKNEMVRDMYETMTRLRMQKRIELVPREDIPKRR